MKSFLEDLILNSELDIDEVEARFCSEFANEDADVLGMIWVEVLNEMPELN